MKNIKTFFLLFCLTILLTVIIGFLSCGKKNTDTSDETGTSFFPTVNI